VLLGAAPLERATSVSLLRWLRRQLQQPEPLRERLEAAIEHGDPAEARRIVARFAFSAAQRHHVDRLIDDWVRRRDRRSYPAGLPSGRELDRAHPERSGRP
jgi:hypothetical protein